MKKILVPAVDVPISSDVAYRVIELADVIGADIIFLFVVRSFVVNSYRVGNHAIELFEEAAQNYDVGVDGYIMKGEPAELICRMSEKWGASLILLGCDEDSPEEQWTPVLASGASCPVELLDNLSPAVGRSLEVL